MAKEQYEFTFEKPEVVEKKDNVVALEYPKDTFEKNIPESLGKKTVKSVCDFMAAFNKAAAEEVVDTGGDILKKKKKTEKVVSSVVNGPSSLYKLDVQVTRDRPYTDRKTGEKVHQPHIATKIKGAMLPGKTTLKAMRDKYLDSL